ncbi:MAG TPA: N-acyl homoserine lactonase family protein [Clostridiaceae bacterium]|nr:N-acyl homoserine lactonase family protein [Clostridiaceae bacterium]
MKVYVLYNGYLIADKNLVVSGATLGTLDKPQVDNIMLNMPMIAVLIDHPTAGKILYDTGGNPRGMDGWWPEALKQGYAYYYEPHETLVEQLKMCDTKPEEINTVILSHMHMDHAGNMELFPHADVYVPKADYYQALSIVHMNQDRNTHSGYIKEEVTAPAKQYHLVDENDDFELFPGIEIINLPGHTPGLLGLIAHTENDGTLIFPQDAVYTAEIYGPPAKQAGLMFDNIAFQNSVEKVRRLADKYDAKLFYAHDVEALDSFRFAPEFYS